MNPIFSIGYGNRTEKEFLALLNTHGIQRLIDVRTHPSKNWEGKFDSIHLKKICDSNGIHYQWEQNLGGKPTSNAFKTPDGLANYTKMAKAPNFIGKLGEIAELAETETVCLMCSEKKPEDCHRTMLIGKTLARLEIAVSHIDEAGIIVDQPTAESRRDKGQITLFPEMF